MSENSLQDDVRELRAELRAFALRIEALNVRLAEVRTEKRLMNAAWAGTWGLVSGAMAGVLARFFESR